MLYDHYSDDRHAALREECRAAGIGPALPSTIISALHLDSQERLTAAEWREVARLVREEIKPLKEQRAERLANLRKEE